MSAVPLIDAQGLRRFMARIEVQEDGCWFWTGGRSSNGYGSFSVGRRNYGAHRISYRYFIGPIPSGLEPDHLCRVRHCVNPEHLEAVTRAENLRRGAGPALNKARGEAQTHCRRGHEFTPKNTYRRPTGGRACRKCRTAAQRRYLDRKAAAS